MSVGALAVVPANSATYRAQISFQPGGNELPSVAGCEVELPAAGYRVYIRAAGNAYGPPQDVGFPTPGRCESPSAVVGPGECELRCVVVSGLDVRTTYFVAMSAYGEPGTEESELSDELSIGYTDVAPFVDSDSDGLTDWAEDVNLNQIVDPGETDPEDPDTDGDGVLDGADHCQGTLPGVAVDTVGCGSCETLVVRKLKFKISRKRKRFFGRAVIVPPLEIDPRASGVAVELINESGASLYRSELPGGAFEKTRARRIFRFRGRKRPLRFIHANGLKKLIFKKKKRRTVVLLEAATRELAELPETPYLTWLIRSGTTCITISS